jgi:hypothetical protein
MLLALALALLTPSSMLARCRLCERLHDVRFATPLPPSGWAPLNLVPPNPTEESALLCPECAQAAGRRLVRDRRHASPLAAALASERRRATRR